MWSKGLAAVKGHCQNESNTVEKYYVGKGQQTTTSNHPVMVITINHTPLNDSTLKALCDCSICIQCVSRQGVATTRGSFRMRGNLLGAWQVLTLAPTIGIPGDKLCPQGSIDGPTWGLYYWATWRAPRVPSENSREMQSNPWTTAQDS